MPHTKHFAVIHVSAWLRFAANSMSFKCYIAWLYNARLPYLACEKK